jgi:hypothetical protein
MSAVWVLLEPKFRRIVSPPSSGRKESVTYGLLLAANVVPSSLILPTLNMEETRSLETSVLTRHTAPHSRKQHSSNLIIDKHLVG